MNRPKAQTAEEYMDAYLRKDRVLRRIRETLVLCRDPLCICMDPVDREPLGDMIEVDGVPLRSPSAHGNGRLWRSSYIVDAHWDQPVILSFYL